MRIMQRHLKGFSLILLAVLLTALLAACQPASAEYQPDPRAASAPDSVTPTPENSTPPPAITATPENSNTLLTPIDKLGITGKTQYVDISTYRLTISGLIEKPLSLTYQDILDYPSVTEIDLLECPGYFKDIAEWTGVPLNTLLAEAGLTFGASQVTFYAADGYHMTLSLEHITEVGVFLAYKVNGVTLPPEHGYPLRVVDKGSAGATWVKWLESIEVK